MATARLPATRALLLVHRLEDWRQVEVTASNVEHGAYRSYKNFSSANAAASVGLEQRIVSLLEIRCHPHQSAEARFQDQKGNLVGIRNRIGQRGEYQGEGIHRGLEIE